MGSFPQMKLQEFELDGRRYLYWVQGDSNNPPLVLLYGFTGVAKDFIELADLLKDKYFIIIPEFPGWNGSSRLPAALTIHNYAKFFKKLFDHFGIPKISLFGHCLGTVVATEFTYLYPEMIKKTILVSTPYLGGSKAEKFQRFLMRRAEHSPQALRPIFFFWRSRIITVPLDFFAIKLPDLDKKLARIKEHIFKQPTEPEDILEENWISYIKFDFKKVKEIKLAVNLIHGAEDILISPNQAIKLQKLFPNASLDIIPTAGHVPPVETPVELGKLMRKYLT